MLYVPFDLEHSDRIIQTIQDHARRFLDCQGPHAETIASQDLLDLVPDMHDQFNSYGLRLDVARFYVTPPGYVLPIHQDGSPENEKYWAFNLPIFNCRNTSMMWYEIKGSFYTVEREMYSPKPVRVFRTEDCTEIHRFELTGPTWVRVNIPHSVDNPVNSGNRVIISMRFFDTPGDWHPGLLRRQRPLPI